MKNSLRFFIRVSLVMTVLFAITLLTACDIGTSCKHRDANDDFLCDLCDKEFDDGKDGCVHRDADDDYQCDFCGDKYNDGTDIPDEKPDDNPGGGSGGGSGDSDTLADMSLVDISKFCFGFKLDTLDFMREAYLNAYTEDMFVARLEIYFGYEGYNEQLMTEWTDLLPISVDSERLNNDMTFLVTAEEAQAFIESYLDEMDSDSIERSIRAAVRDVVDRSPSEEQYETFIDEVFGDDEFRALLNSTFGDGFEIGRAEDYGLNDFADRDPVVLINRIEGNAEWSRFNWMSYLPLSYFDDSQLAVEYCIGDDYYEDYFDFSVADYADELRELGLTVTDDGVLVNDAFYDVLYDGFNVSEAINLKDGTTVDVNYTVLTSSSVYYTIEVPESIEAELNFEGGISVSFDVSVSGESHTVAVTDYRYYSEVTPSSYIGQISKWLSQLGNLRESVSTKLVMKVPDSVSFVAYEIPVNEYAFEEKLKEVGVFTFTYGERTTILKAGVNSQLGIGFDSLIDYLSVKDGDSRNPLLTYMLLNNSTYLASDTPYAISCVSKQNSEGEEFDVNVSIQLDSIISSIALVDKNCIGNSYYIGDELEIALGAEINVYRRSAFRGTDYLVIENTVPVTVDMIEGFDSSNENDNGYMYVKYEGLSTAPISYQIKRDFVTSIEVKIPAWGIDVYVIGLRLNLDDVTLTAFYDSGRDKENIPLSADMLSDLPTSTGTHQLTVSYEGQTDTISVQAVKAKSATIYDGLASYYLLGEKPTSVEVRVDFENNQFGYDYDIVVLGEEELASFDTLSSGDKTWSFSWAGVSVSHDYKVVEKAYVGYTPSDDGITINGVFIDEAPEFYYELTSFAELNIPAKIGDVPVVAIGAGAFKDLNMISKLTVEEGVVSIGDYAFRNASGLLEVHLPQSATNIGKKIFEGCTALEKMYISGSKKILDYFNDDMGSGVEVYVNEGEDTLCADFLTLKADMRISNVVLPSTLTTITLKEDTTEFWAMYYLCQYVLNFEVTPGGIYSAIDGVLYGDYGKTLLCYPMDKTTQDFTVPDGVERIVFMAYNPYLKTLTVPASVNTLGENVFTMDESLTTVTLLGTLTALPDGCFSNCTSLTNFTLPKTLVSIGASCFERTNISTIVVPDSVTSIGYNAFMQCGVKKLAIPKSAMASFKTLGEQYLTSLTDFAYDGSVYIRNLNAIKYDFGKIPPNLKNIYVYGTTSFEGGICSSTYHPFNVYIDASIKTITYGTNEQSSGSYKVQYFYAGPLTDLSNSCNIAAQYNPNFSKWYLG